MKKNRFLRDSWVLELTETHLVPVKAMWFDLLHGYVFGFVKVTKTCTSPCVPAGPSFVREHREFVAGTCWWNPKCLSFRSSLKYKFMWPKTLISCFCFLITLTQHLKCSCQISTGFCVFVLLQIWVDCNHHTFVTLVFALVLINQSSDEGHLKQVHAIKSANDSKPALLSSQTSNILCLLTVLTLRPQHTQTPKGSERWMKENGKQENGFCLL